MKLTLDTKARVPHGYTVMNPAASGLVTVTFSDTESTPSAGTNPTRSVSRTSSIPFASILAVGTVRNDSTFSERVSKTRLGPTDVKAAPAANHPLTSTL